MSCRQPLHLSFFSLDDFEHAIRHSFPDPPCNLLAEVHSVLIYNLRTVPFARHAAVISLSEARDNSIDRDVEGLPSVDALTDALVETGNNWERVPLKHGEGREGWQEALIGCLKDVGLFLIKFHCRVTNLIDMLARDRFHIPKITTDIHETLV